ncbi:ribosome biogenesis protein SLX9-domain-containing protein [Blakeslea trispora]|nr:ribosome biogenesis protein SLX9-domain-containing protein [Blakeslea trispora]KAI8370212.1 ribosome biogenesis protein SLX9-domain-containing protein [Blakeslea trispora]
MPKAARKSIRKTETPLRQRKFAVSEKEVVERIVTEGDQISTVSAQTMTIVKKDEKKKKRHESWLQKLDHAYAVKKKMEKKQNKSNNLKVNLGNFGDILNGIQFKPKSEFASQATHGKKLKEPTQQEPAIPSNKIKSKKAKKQAELQEILRMQKVMQHGAFKQNPLDTIRQHVQNTFSS